MNDIALTYRAPVVTPPGDSLAELLEERGMSQAELATRMGRPHNAINEVVKGVKQITADTAVELEKALGVPARFWLAREARYREYLARQKTLAADAQHLGWLEAFPLKDLQNTGHLPEGSLTPAFKATLVGPLLQFFGVASPLGWENQYNGNLQLAFRRANPAKQTNTAAISAWLRWGELAAARLNLPAHDPSKLRANLPAMRKLSTRPAAEIGAQLPQLCAQAGVALLFVPPLPGTHVTGVARWFGDKPLVQLSLLGKWNDVFWFSFFHELGHVLLHPKKAVFLDDAASGQTKKSPEEQEADKFAADTLIPPPRRRQLPALTLNIPAVQFFASSLGIHPGIVVGALQHQGLLSYSHPLRDLKEKYSIAAPA